MKYLIALLILAFLTGCGGWGESETPVEIVSVDAKPAECELPKPEKFKVANRAVIDELTSCLRLQLDDGFKRVRGSHPGEFSLGEVKTIFRKGIFRGPDGVDIHRHWETIGLLLSFWDDQGRSVLTHKKASQILDWAERHADLVYRFWMQEKNLDKSLEWDLILSGLNAGEEFVDLISDKFRLKREDLEAAIDTALTVSSQVQGKPTKPAQEWIDSIRSLWNVKGLVLVDEYEQGTSFDISGHSLKELIRMAIRAGKLAKLTHRWAMERLLPAAIPPGIPDEWRRISEVVQSYFQNKLFDYVHLSDLQRAYYEVSRRVDYQGKAGPLYGLIPDLVRIAQRLSPYEYRFMGIHPQAYLPFLSEAEHLGADLVSAAKAFPDSCTRDFNCRVSIRQVAKHPVLKRLIFKGEYQYDGYSVSGKHPAKRWDSTISFHQVTTRATQRRLISKIFEAFDQDKDGLMPFSGDMNDGAKEVLNLSYTLLRFLTKEETPDPKERITPVPRPAFIKPDALYRSLGLVGDTWMPDSNVDGSLDKDEFFSATSLYQLIEDKATLGFMGEGGFDDLDGGTYFFSRPAFIDHLPKHIESTLPFMVPQLKAMGREVSDLFFHGLVELSPGPRQGKKIEYYPNNSQNHNPVVEVSDPVSASAALGPMAILTLMDRLMILCDKNEDDKLSWKEMDCAAPRMIGAGLYAVASRAVNIEAPVSDIAYLSLKMINESRLGMTIAKMILVGGSVKKLDFERIIDVVEKAKPQLMVKLAGSYLSLKLRNYSMLRAFNPVSPARPNPLNQLAEEKLRFLDENKDGKISDEELSKFHAVVIGDLYEYLEDFENNQALIGRIVERIFGEELKGQLTNADDLKLVVPLLVVLGTQLDSVLDENDEIYTDPAKILRVLAELLERDKPFEPLESRSEYFSWK